MAVGGSARGQMRPHSSKSPPFLLVGLFVVIAILGFNYWNASTKYAFSRKQVIQLSDKYQELNLKKQGIEKRNLDLVDELNERKTEVMKCLAKNSVDATSCENRIRREKDDVMADLSAGKLEIDNLKQQGKECQDNFMQCQVDMSSADENIKKTKDEMKKECDEKVRQAVQSVNVESFCAIVKSTERVNILKIVKHRLGVQALLVLQKSGIDLSGIIIDKNELAAAQRQPQGTHQMPGQAQQPQVVLSQGQEHQLRHQQQPQIQGQQPVQQGQVSQQQLNVGYQHLPSQGSRQQPGDIQQQQHLPGQGSQQQPGQGSQQQPGQGSQQQPDDKRQLPGLGSPQQPNDKQQLPGLGSPQQPNDKQQLPGLGSPQQPNDKQQLPGLGSQQQPNDKQQLPGLGSQQQPNDKQQLPGLGSQQQPDQGQGIPLMPGEGSKAANIGVGESTVTPSNVSVTQPVGGVTKGVMGRSHDGNDTATSPLKRNLDAGSPIGTPPTNNASGLPAGPRAGGSIMAPPGAAAFNQSLPAPSSNISGVTKPVVQNVTFVSTQTPVKEGGQVEHVPGTSATPGTKTDVGRDAEESLDDAPLFDGGEHGEISDVDGLQRERQEQNDAQVKQQQINAEAFRPVGQVQGQEKDEIDVNRVKFGGQ